MRFLEGLAGILLIVLDFIWAIIKGIGKGLFKFLDGPIGVILIIIIFIIVFVSTYLYFETFYVLLGTFFVLTILMGILMHNEGGDAGSVIMGSAVLTFIIYVLTYIIVDIALDFNDKKTISQTEVVWEMNNIKYIASPNGDYIIMDINTTEQKKISDQTLFYSFEQLECTGVMYTHDIVRIIDYHEKFTDTKNTQYHCIK